MKISIFATISNPEQRQDPYLEAIRNYLDFADEVVVVYGDCDDAKIYDRPTAPLYGYDAYPTSQFVIENLPKNDKIKHIYHKWPKEFDWRFISQQFQRGYDACTGDIVFRMDIDYLIHENNFEDIRTFLEDNPDYPAYVMPKKQFILADRFRVKSLVPIAFNKGKFGDRIRLDSGGDLCQPSLDGKELKNCRYGEVCPKDKMPIISRKDYVVINDSIDADQIKKRLPNLQKKGDKFYTQYRGIHFWNYDFTFKTQEIIKKDFGRFARAWYKTFGEYHLGGPTDESAFEYFKSMQLGRITNGGWTKCNSEDHPNYIQDKIKNIKSEQLGYNLWGLYDKSA